MHQFHLFGPNQEILGIDLILASELIANNHPILDEYSRFPAAAKLNGSLIPNSWPSPRPTLSSDGSPTVNIDSINVMPRNQEIRQIATRELIATWDSKSNR
jgi:hypothetical protein